MKTLINERAQNSARSHTNALVPTLLHIESMLLVIMMLNYLLKFCDRINLICRVPRKKKGNKCIVCLQFVTRFICPREIA